MNPAATFAIESLATHPFRKERGKAWGTLIVSGSEKGWASPPSECLELTVVGYRASEVS